MYGVKQLGVSQKLQQGYIIMSEVYDFVNGRREAGCSI
jgi:hypothetical protein